MSDMRLIDADALKATIVQNYRREFFGSILWNILDDMPTIDAVPVVHARWELFGADKRGRGGVFNCTACNRCRPTKSDYCPNCGAKMDGGASDD